MSPWGKISEVMSFRWRLATKLLVVFAGAVLGAAGMAVLGPFGARVPLWNSALAGHGTPRPPLNAQRVYNRLAPSILDITAVLRYDDETAEGTGFVIDSPRALVITNNHVIKDATSITATLVSTGKTYRVSLVGADSAADIAVLRLDGQPRLAAAPAGDSRDTQLGDQVLVIGNQAGQGGPPTIAPGIINSLNRTIEATDGAAGFTETLRGMLQTSAQIEPGDSGGPLANASGQVIGVDTAASSGAGAAGFAIPLNSALSAAHRITTNLPGPGAFLGVLVMPGAGAAGQTAILSGVTTRKPPRVIAAPNRTGWDPGRGAGSFTGSGSSCLTTEAEAVAPKRVAPIRSGALVEGVLCGTPAAGSGLTAGDVIVRAAGRAVPSPGALQSILAGCAPGTVLPVTWVDVNGATRTALLRAAPAPAR